jgi:hypothetical protein
MSFPSFSTGEVLTAADMNAVGLWRVGGGALSTAITDFVGVFTSDYTDYRIVIDSVSVSAAADIYFRMLSGSTPATGANYDYAMTSLNSAGTAANVTATSDTYGFTGLSITGAGVGGVVFAASSMDVYSPQLNLRTQISANAVGVIGGAYGSRVGMSVHNLAGVYDGIRIDTRSAVTLTGNVSIYGYRKA